MRVWRERGRLASAGVSGGRARRVGRCRWPARPTGVRGGSAPPSCRDRLSAIAACCHTTHVSTSSSASQGPLPDPASHEITQLLGRLGSDDASAAAALLPLVYDELRALAQSHFARQDPDHTLQATALVHEVYLKLARGHSDRWKGRDHFFAVAAQAMRQVLVDHARRKRAEKRQGSGARIELDAAEALATAGVPPGATKGECDVLDLEEALERLAALDERKARVVTLRFYGGLTNEAVAEVLGIARATVADDWAFARAWLAKELGRP